MSNNVSEPFGKNTFFYFSLLPITFQSSFTYIFTFAEILFAVLSREAEWVVGIIFKNEFSYNLNIVLLKHKCVAVCHFTSFSSFISVDIYWINDL